MARRGNHVVDSIACEEELAAQQALASEAWYHFGKDDGSVLLSVRVKVALEACPVPGAEREAPPPSRRVHCAASHVRTLIALSAAVSVRGFHPFERRDTWSAERPSHSTGWIAAPWALSSRRAILPT